MITHKQLKGFPLYLDEGCVSARISFAFKNSFLYESECIFLFLDLVLVFGCFLSLSWFHCSEVCNFINLLCCVFAWCCFTCLLTYLHRILFHFTVQTPCDFVKCYINKDYYYNIDLSNFLCGSGYWDWSRTEANGCTCYLYHYEILHCWSFSFSFKWILHGSW